MIVTRENDTHDAGFRMPGNISQRFLHDSVDRDLHVRREPWGVVREAGAVEDRPDSFLVSPGPFTRQARERGLQPEVVEGGRPQFQRDAVNVELELFGRFFQVRQFIQRGAGQLWQPGAGFESEQQCRKILADVVVQLARQVAAFVFMRGDQALQESFAFFFGALAVSDVLADADAGSIGEAYDGPGGIDEAAVTGFRFEVEPFAVGRGNRFASAAQVLCVRVDFRQDIAFAFVVLRLRQRPAKRAFPFLIHQFQTSGRVAESNHHGNVVNDLLQDLGLFAELVLRFLALGDVEHDAAEVKTAARFALHRDDVV
jgi:hypothetical protein